MIVEVIRGVGDKPSPEVIVDELCSNTHVGVNRGRVYLNDTGFNKAVVNISVPYIYEGWCGRTASIVSNIRGLVYRGRITNVNISGSVSSDKLKIDTSLTIICELPND